MFAFDPQILLAATPPIPGHAIVALLALGLGAWQLLAAKGTRRHRITGWLFVVAMAYVALSALWIAEIRLIGRFSPIHLLIPVVLISLGIAIRAVRRGNVETHARTMRSLVVFALLITGGFTLLPGRIMYQTLFGPSTAATTLPSSQVSE